jgi:hypothetical protein
MLYAKYHHIFLGKNFLFHRYTPVPFAATQKNYLVLFPLHEVLWQFLSYQEY